MDRVKYSGRLFQVIDRQTTYSFQNNGENVRKPISYELIRRPPGVRAIVVNEGKILLNREYRYELGKWDLRLPGGKVFDSNEEYCLSVSRGNLSGDIREKVKEELLEESEIIAEDYTLFCISHCGFTVEWDLYYFIVNRFKTLPSFCERKINVREYEFIEPQWIGLSEVKDLALSGMMSEDRSIIALLKFLNMQEKYNELRK